MFVRIFFNAHACADVKENNQCFRKQINNTGKHHKRDMIGFKDVKMQKALGKSNDQKQKAGDFCV